MEHICILHFRIFISGNAKDAWLSFCTCFIANLSWSHSILFPVLMLGTGEDVMV